MAVLTVTADHAPLAAAKSPLLQNPSGQLLDPFLHGTVKRRVFKIRQAATANDIIRLADDMPPCTILSLSRVVRTGGTVASLTLNVGHQEFTDVDGDVNGGDIDAFASALDIAAAGVDTFDEVGTGFLVDSKSPWTLLCQIAGANIVAATELDIEVYYITNE